MIRRVSLCYLGVIGCVLWLSAQQDSLPINRDFVFADGIYEDLAALQTNRPDRSMRTLDGRMVLLQEDYMLKVEELHPKGRPDLALDLEEIAAITVNGVPYIRTYHDSIRGFTEFAGLRVRGRLCYYSYEKTELDSVLIQAFNPITGRPFRQQMVVNPRLVQVEKVLDLENGIVWPFTLPVMLDLLANDEALVQSLQNLQPAEAEARLQRCLLIYDDRHPLLAPVGE